jgi:hypothetical protein
MWGLTVRQTSIKVHKKTAMKYIMAVFSVPYTGLFIKLLYLHLLIFWRFGYPDQEPVLFPAHRLRP